MTRLKNLRNGMLMRRPLAVAIVMALGLAFGAVPGMAEESNTKATQQMFDAVQANDLPSVQSSVAGGADVSARNAWGLTAAELAVDMGYFRIAHYLISVRNLRERHESQSDKDEPSTAPGSTPAGNTAGKASAAGKTGKSVPIAPTPTKASTTAAVKAPELAEITPWPASIPNPFDPQTPVFGSRFPLRESR